jgi:cbb3-type cytochrome oxidase subunit 3
MSAAEFSLIAVTVSFLGLVAWVYWPSHRSRLEAHGAMPLDDDAGATPEAERNA